MWEITLVGESNDIAHFRLLCDTLHSSYVGVVCALSESAYTYCSIATNINEIVPEIEHIIVGMIVKIAKIKYFNENLNLFKKYPLFRNFAINSIALADIDDEIKFVLNNFQLDKKVYLNSFVQFRLRVLVKVWSRICSYLSSSYNSNMESEWCLDFLKFVSTNIDTSEEIIKIYHLGQKIKVHNLSSGKIRYFDISNEIGIIFYLIVNAPKKVIVQYFENVDDKLNLLLTYIFDDRLCNVM